LHGSDVLACIKNTVGFGLANFLGVNSNRNINGAHFSGFPFFFANGQAFILRELIASAFQLFLNPII
jgi:hypothetical protein